MEEPKLTVVGVYRPQISQEVWKEQWKVTEDDEETREHFASLVLIEAIVEIWQNPWTWEASDRWTRISRMT